MSHRRSEVTAATVLVTMAIGLNAQASPKARLRLAELPPPRPTTLSMRATTPPPIAPTPPAPRRTSARVADPAAGQLGVPPRNDKIRVRLDLGFGADGARPSGEPTTSGGNLNADYASARFFGFGAVYLSTHGLVAAPLQTYLALGFRVVPAVDAVAPLADALDNTDDLQIRAGWAETDNLSEVPLLKTLRLRAGRQYSYGVWPLHYDGAELSWSGRGLRASTFGGAQVNDYRISENRRTDGVLGGQVRVDLAAYKLVPLAITVSALGIGNRFIADLDVLHTYREVVRTSVGSRIIDGAATHERLRIRVAPSRQSHIGLDVDHRSASDWRWDVGAIGARDPGAARDYLELGPPAAEVRGVLRGGAVLFDNIDLLGRVGVALTTDAVSEVADLHSSDWLEAGLSAEVRLRRTVTLGASVLARDYDRDVLAPIIDMPGPQTLPTVALGEESFLEGGATIRLDLGARSLSVGAEFYARGVRYSAHYLAVDAVDPTPTQPTDTRSGGRFTIDAWATRRVRLRLAYDLSSSLALAPEIAGYKSLRLTAEGSF